MELHISSKRPSWSSSLTELFAYRDLLWILAYREISIRYKQTAVGVLWVVLQPVLATLLLTVIFGRFAKLPSEGIPSILFNLCGMTIWFLFAHSVERAGQSIIADEKLITKVYFPRATIPLASIISSGVDFLVSFVVLIVAAACYGFLPGLTLPAIIPAILIALLASAGIGTALAGWTVRYRDFRYIIPFFLQLALFASPTFYSVSLIPEQYRLLYFLNPMAGAIELFRYGITGATMLHPAGIALSAVVSVVLFLAGGGIFRQVEQSFADHI
jgi:lipopolysaccharide transport system permease protein